MLYRKMLAMQIARLVQRCEDTTDAPESKFYAQMYLKKAWGQLTFALHQAEGLSRLVARRQSPSPFVFERGMVVVVAKVVGNRTAVVESASGWRVYGYGDRSLYIGR